MRSLESMKASINQELMNEIYYTKIMKKNKGNEHLGKFELKIDKNSINNDTFNNFKSLRKIKNQVYVLDYEQIYKKIQDASSTLNERLFDYSKELKKIENDKKRFIGIEDDLLEKYITLSKEIKQKVNLEKQIRMVNYMNNKKIVTQKENVKIY